MKKLICYLLIAWLGFMSVGANAHATSDAAHNAMHQISEAASANTPSDAEQDSVEKDHQESCSHAHCGHGHHAGLAMSLGAAVAADASATAHTSSSSWFSSTVANYIERPKWLLTTLAVVSLLS